MVYILYEINISDHDGNIVLALPYSFKAKPRQLHYLDNGYWDSMEAKVKII